VNEHELSLLMSHEFICLLIFGRDGIVVEVDPTQQEVHVLCTVCNPEVTTMFV